MLVAGLFTLQKQGILIWTDMVVAPYQSLSYTDLLTPHLLEVETKGRNIAAVLLVLSPPIAAGLEKLCELLELLLLFFFRRSCFCMSVNPNR